MFSSFRQFCADRFGAEVSDVWRDVPEYGVDRAYDDDDFRELLVKVCEATGSSQPSVLREFGAHAGLTVFAALYPDYYAETPDARTFLLNIEERIHEVVRATIPQAAPPRLRVLPLGERDVLISYTSERRFCELLDGLVRGTAAYFGERLAIEELQCMHRGDVGCLFLVRNES